MEQIKKLSIFLISSNLLIAFASMSQSFLTYKILNIPLNYAVLLVEGSATLLLYNLSLGLSMPKELNNSSFFRTQWYFRNRLIFWMFNIIAIIIAIYACLNLHWHTFLLLGLVGLMSLGYTFPILKIGGKSVALRQIVGLKVFLIAIVWSLSVVWLPVVEYYSTSDIILWQSAFYWSILVALFILAITIPFDIRDIKQDNIYKLKTIPIILGEAKAKSLCYFLIVGHAILLFAFVDLSTGIFSLILVDFVVLLLFRKYLFKPSVHYESVYVLDFMLIIQCLITVPFL